MCNADSPHFRHGFWHLANTWKRFYCDIRPEVKRFLEPAQGLNNPSLNTIIFRWTRIWSAIHPSPWKRK